MKQYSLLTFFLLSSVGIQQSLAQSTFGDFEYTVNGGTVTITKFLCGSPTAVIPQTIELKPVRTIASEAFLSCTSLESVVISPGIQTIESFAFFGCSSLTTVYLPPSINSIDFWAFRNCTNLDNLILASATPPTTPGGSIGIDPANTSVWYVYERDWVVDTWADLPVRKLPFPILFIGDEAKLYPATCPVDAIEIDIPSSINGATVKTIPLSFFANCANLTRVGIPDTVELIDDSAFAFCTSLTTITIPENVTYLGQYAFQGCSNLTSVTFLGPPPFIQPNTFIPDNPSLIIYYPEGTPGWDTTLPGVTKLPILQDFEYYVSEGEVIITKFMGSEADVVIPATVGAFPVTAIADNAFQDSPNLTSVTIPDGVLRIGAFAFAECPNLTRITIPASVFELQIAAFRGCTSLTEIVVDTDNQSYASLDGVLFTKDLLYLLQFPLAVGGAYAVPDGVTSIMYAAFSDCDGLTAVTMPDSVTYISQDAFSNCDNLENVKLSAGLTSIDGYVFADCISLTSLTIPAGVPKLWDYFFLNCESLTSLYFLGSPPQITGTTFFEVNPALTVYYVEGTPGWGETFNIFPTSSFVPEPANWGDYAPVEASGKTYVDTGSWLGWLDITGKPWIWSLSTNAWYYIPDSVASSGTGWIYLPALATDTPDLWLVMVPGTDYGWSYGLSQWLYVSPGSLQAGAGWVYLL